MVRVDPPDISVEKHLDIVEGRFFTVPLGRITSSAEAVKAEVHIKTLLLKILYGTHRLSPLIIWHRKYVSSLLECSRKATCYYQTDLK